MAKTTGLAWTTCSVDDNSGAIEAIINDVVSLNFSPPRAVQDITGIDKSAHERQLLLSDFSISLTCVANFANSPSMFDVFKTVPMAAAIARTVTLVVGGKTLPNEVLFTDFPLSRGAGGELMATVPGVLAGGVVPTWA